MNKKALLGVVIGVVIIGVVVGVLMYLQSQSPATPSSNSTSSGSPKITDENDHVGEGNVSVGIQNFSFLQNKVTIKKGTTVTWTNQDTVKHNVVATDRNNTGGLPTDSPLLAKGESFSHTFNEVGTFTYKCAPHPNMTGTVEVVE